MDIDEASEIGTAHSYFVPMVDMLAGVVFILVILLAAVSLVARDEFAEAQEMQSEIARINAELATARMAQARYLDPRRDAETAMRLLMQRVQAKLAARGVSSSVDPAGRTLRIAGTDLFGTSMTLLPEGQRVAAALAGALYDELACLAEGDALPPQGCDLYRAARLDSVGILADTAAGEATMPNGARALSLFAAIVAADPRLIALRSADGTALVDHRSSATSPGAGGARDVEISFQMQLPAFGE